MRIDIISGFLGAGKTTFIRRLLDTNLKNEKVVLIENEYGEISVDSDLLSDKKIEIRELSQGCICCSLAGDFSKSLKEIVDKYNPERIIIEPSGVGKLTDIILAVSDAGYKDNVNSLVCMVDAKKAKMYDRNFGEFFVDQIKSAHTVILSRTDVAKEDTIQNAVEIVRKHNESCVVVTTPIKDLSDEELIKAYEGFDVSLLDEIEEEHHHHHHHDEEECDDPNCECHHHHHDDDDDGECECHHHHHHDEECDDPNCECHHHHHDDNDDDECECHHHHHHDEEECDDPNCECHHHHHHHGHAADEVFKSYGFETVKRYDLDLLKANLDKIANGEFGMIVRSKGIILANDGKWYAFNLTPEEVEIKPASAIPTGKIVVIGSNFDKETIKKLF